MLQSVPQPERDEDVMFDFLRSTKKCGVVFTESTYALLKTPEVSRALCFISHIVAFGGNTYMWVRVYPPTLLVDDQMGVATANLLDMHNSQYDPVCEAQRSIPRLGGQLGGLLRVLEKLLLNLKAAPRFAGTEELIERLGCWLRGYRRGWLGEISLRLGG